LDNFRLASVSWRLVAFLATHMTLLDKTDHAERSNTQTDDSKALNLALQGGGSHGAFAWGVLDRLLDEETLHFEGISGTSAGAANAVVLADGLAVGGREGARQALRAYWQRVSDLWSRGPFNPPLIGGREFRFRTREFTRLSIH
jgi:predicted acylesterase/phospholipase RssA